jgi:hypothetical protein
MSSVDKPLESLPWLYYEGEIRLGGSSDIDPVGDLDVILRLNRAGVGI